MDLDVIDLSLKVAHFTALFIFGIIGITVGLIQLSNDKK